MKINKQFLIVISINPCDNFLYHYNFFTKKEKKIIINFYNRIRTNEVKDIFINLISFINNLSNRYVVRLKECKFNRRLIIEVHFIEKFIASMHSYPNKQIQTFEI